MRRAIKDNPTSLLFALLCVIGWHYSGMSAAFLCNEVMVRFVRNGVLVLALLIPLTAGMGLNFAISVGAIAAQTGVLLALNAGVGGLPGLGLAAVVGCLLALGAGWLIGRGLNLVKGKEMIATMIIGFLATCLYQLVFLVGYGSLIPAYNQEMLLSRGVGVRSTVDLLPYRHGLDTYWLIHLGPLEVPLFMILVVLGCALGVRGIMRSRIGGHFRAVGQDVEKARLLGLDVEGVRVQAMMLSTTIACLGQLFHLQNIGMMNVYTAHLNAGIFSCAALLAGGATLYAAGVGNAFLGLLLFHALFIVSPQAGQNLFQNAALGEYFRSFTAYGTIAFALILNPAAPRRTRPRPAAEKDAPAGD
ncbi:ABC transporter permease subunit [Megalodesulfovibrio gigas]|uniref:Putative ABC transporter integral membrane protein n=1 Tax=Megalodesulfovibrio gigas (strain ATCC 19364 / DSM 1382 / NCIMB 9332 / VKM B-1759) TaxID=1121448 RepID=T2GFQ0_MEGG1|nr:ABC transporter integral membrane protein [Megalodesulfovibrio gigas]AGW15024.1 putative ABC transporter integral membrane protein [Megalodesulfovibrio gigas DSM 1382 = ATCC 19364]